MTIMQVNRIISLSDACEKYEKTSGGFYASAYICKGKSGVYPDWYLIDDNGKITIDTYEYERWADLERRAWLYATNDIYYILAYDFGLTDAKIARFMARHSKKFTIEASWSTFLTKSLFSLPQDSILQKRLSMTQEFFYTGCYLIKILMDDEK